MVCFISLYLYVCSWLYQKRSICFKKHGVVGAAIIFSDKLYHMYNALCVKLYLLACNFDLVYSSLNV